MATRIDNAAALAAYEAAMHAQRRDAWLRLAKSTRGKAMRTLYLSFAESAHKAAMLHTKRARRLKGKSDGSTAE